MSFSWDIGGEIVSPLDAGVNLEAGKAQLPAFPYGVSDSVDP